MNTKHSITPWGEPSVKTFRLNYLQQLHYKNQADHPHREQAKHRRANSMVQMLNSEQFLSALAQQSQYKGKQRPIRSPVNDPDRLDKIRAQLTARIRQLSSSHRRNSLFKARSKMLDRSERRIRCMHLQDPMNQGVLFRSKKDLFSEKSFLKLPRVQIKMKR